MVEWGGGVKHSTDRQGEVRGGRGTSGSGVDWGRLSWVGLWRDR